MPGVYTGQQNMQLTRYATDHADSMTALLTQIRCLRISAPKHSSLQPRCTRPPATQQSQQGRLHALTQRYRTTNSQPCNMRCCPTAICCELRYVCRHDAAIHTSCAHLPNHQNYPTHATPGPQPHSITHSAHTALPQTVLEAYSQELRFALCYASLVLNGASGGTLHSSH
jgi:hypothetical protein